MTCKRLEGKVALITGGASGIGESTTKLFVLNGAKVVIADIQDDLGHALCSQLGSETTYVHCDVTVESDVQSAVDLAVSKYGKLDIMYNNAGIQDPSGATILSSNYDSFKKIIDVNLYGGFLGAKHAARVMIPAKTGCILFTSSTASVTASGLFHSYVASKHAVVGLTKSLCVELGEYGIRVNSISPYVVATPMIAKFVGKSTDMKKVEEGISSTGNLKGVILKSEDVAKAALYLGSDDAKYVSGVNLVVDGGYSVTNPSFANALQNLLSLDLK